MSQECDSFEPLVSSIDEPDLVCHEVHPGGPPPGYKRIEVFAPYPEDAITEEEALGNSFIKKVKKNLKKNIKEDLTITLKCKYLRDVN